MADESIIKLFEGKQIRIVWNEKCRIFANSALFYCGDVTNVTNVTYHFQQVHFPKLDTQIRQVYSISPEKTLVSQDFYPRKFFKKT